MHLAWFTYMERGKGFTGRAGNVLSSPTSADVLRQEGNNFKSTATLARWTGAVSEDSLPYETEPSPDKSASDYPNRLHLRDVFYLGRDRKKPDDMVWKTLIRRYGAISIAYCSDPQYYTRYGVSFYNSNSDDGANHEVLAVGWDDNYPKENFRSDQPRPARDGAWLVKNSWGPVSPPAPRPTVCSREKMRGVKM